MVLALQDQARALHPCTLSLGSTKASQQWDLRGPICVVHWGPPALLGDFQAPSYQQCQPKSLLHLIARSSLPSNHPGQDGKLDVGVGLLEE